MSVEFPKSIRKIGENAFIDCKNLLFVNLQEGIENIPEGSFNNTPIKEILIPNSVTYISPYAFPNDTVIIRPPEYHPEGMLTTRMVRECLSTMPD